MSLEYSYTTHIQDKANSRRRLILEEIDAPRYPLNARRREIPIEQVPSLLRTRLDTVPEELVGPTFESIVQVVQRRDSKKRQATERDPRTPEEALITYVRKLTDPGRTEQLEDADKKLLERVEVSKHEYEYHEDLERMKLRTKTNLDAVTVLAHDWKELHSEQHLFSEKPAEEIAADWRELQSLLERQKGNNPDASIFRAKRLVRKLRETPAEGRAHALWQHAFTEQQKENVTDVLHKHQESIRLGRLARRYAHEEVTTATEYKNAAFRGFLKHLRASYGTDPETGWADRISMVSNFYPQMEQVLIPSIDTLPPNVLGTFGEVEVYKHRLEDQRFNTLHGLAAEISLAMLMSGSLEK